MPTLLLFDINQLKASLHLPLHLLSSTACPSFHPSAGSPKWISGFPGIYIWCFRIKQRFQTLDTDPSTKFHPLKRSWTPSKLFWCELTRQQWLKGWKLTIKLLQSATFYDCVHIKMRHVPQHYPRHGAGPCAPGDQCRCITMDRERNGSRLTGRRCGKLCLWR